MKVLRHIIPILFPHHTCMYSPFQRCEMYHEPVNANQGIASWAVLSPEVCNSHRPLTRAEDHHWKVLVSKSSGFFNHVLYPHFHLTQSFLTNPLFISKPPRPGEFSLSKIDALAVSCPQNCKTVDHHRKYHSTPECNAGRIYSVLSTGCHNPGLGGCNVCATTTAGEVKITGKVKTIGIAFTL